MRGFAIFLLLLPVSVAAEDAALILGNNRYEELGRVPGAAQSMRIENRLENRNYSVFALGNGQSDAVLPVLQGFADAAGEADQLVAVLSGRFVTDGARSWLMLSDATYPTLFGIEGQVVAVESILRVLADRPGAAVLLLGYEDETDAFGPYLREGIGVLDIPQGVTVIRGPVERVGNFARGPFLQPDQDILESARNARLSLSGYVPSRLVMMPEPEAVEDEDQTDDPAADADAWAEARAADDVSGYRGYLQSFPSGRQAEEAQARIDAILAEPFRAERLLEENLELTRAERRTIQRDLTLLSFNTGGIDGIFGRATRNAIQNWQQENGLPQTSYVSRAQITRLDRQADRRRGEIAAAEDARRRAEERADRAFWAETGAQGDAAGYDAYLGRYPDGLFSDDARKALAEISEASDATTPPSNDATQAQINAARNQERAMSQNPIMARLVEGQLGQLGLNPGTVDGQFDRDTRRAIRRYQRMRNLPVTGFMSEATMVRLLADSVEALQDN